MAQKPFSYRERTRRTHHLQADRKKRRALSFSKFCLSVLSLSVQSLSVQSLSVCLSVQSLSVCLSVQSLSVCPESVQSLSVCPEPVWVSKLIAFEWQTFRTAEEKGGRKYFPTDGGVLEARELDHNISGRSRPTTSLWNDVRVRRVHAVAVKQNKTHLVLSAFPMFAPGPPW